MSFLVQHQLLILSDRGSSDFTLLKKRSLSFEKAIVNEGKAVKVSGLQPLIDLTAIVSAIA